jgi:hypothetical protein
MLWGYSVLEYMQGGSTYILQPECCDAHESTSFSALLSTFNDRAYLIVNGFNPDRTHHESHKVKVKVPKGILPFSIGNMKSTSMNNEYCINYNVRKDLYLAHNLRKDVKDRPEWTNRMSAMCKDHEAACNMVVDNWENYTSKWKASLTLADFDGNLVEGEDAYYISLPVNTPESKVILLESE